jgi:hypothetical protein
MCLLNQFVYLLSSTALCWALLVSLLIQLASHVVVSGYQLFVKPRLPLSLLAPPPTLLNFPPLLTARFSSASDTPALFVQHHLVAITEYLDNS